VGVDAGTKCNEYKKASNDASTLTIGKAQYLQIIMMVE
jgi:hypothetical protein